MTPDNDNDPLSFIRLAMLVANVREFLQRQVQQKDGERDAGCDGAGDERANAERENVDQHLNKKWSMAALQVVLTAEGRAVRQGGSDSEMALHARTVCLRETFRRIS